MKKLLLLLCSFYTPLLFGLATKVIPNPVVSCKLVDCSTIEYSIQPHQNQEDKYILILEHSYDAIAWRPYKKYNISKFRDVLEIPADGFVRVTLVSHKDILSDEAWNNGKYISNTIKSTCPNPSHSLSIWPNPASDYIRVFPSRPCKKITIYDSFGRSVREFFGGSERTIDIHDLSAGKYYLHLTSDDRTTVSDFVVIK